MGTVTLIEAKAQLRVTDTSEDAVITKAMAAADLRIAKYLNVGTVDKIPTNGDSPATYPEDIQCAALLIIGDLFENREGQLESAGRGSIVENPTLTSLLYPYRQCIGI